MSTEIVNTDIKIKLLDLFQENLSVIKNDSPDYINKIREKAIELFSKLGFPDKKNENYKYTDVKKEFDNGYKTYLSPKNIKFEIKDIFSCDVPDLNTKVILLLNGWFYDRENLLQELPGGAIIGSLQKAMEVYPELVERHFAKYADMEKEGLVALNTAFVKDGIFLYVPKGVVIEKPIQVINVLMDEEEGFTSHRNLYILEENSQASVVVCDHTLSAVNFLTNSVAEFFVGQNAHFDYSRIQNEHNGSKQISHLFFHQEKDSKVTNNTISLHGGVIRNNISVLLNGEGCENNTYGLYLTDKGQHIDNYIFIDHAKPNCISNQLFKGVLDDFATGAFNGKILVRKDAQKTQAYQANNNILLTDDADIKTRPQLEIYADDVKCSHGATVGQLDENAMFYMRARGIPKKEAKLLLMYAFAHEVIQKIKVPALKDRINDLVEKRLRGELSRCNSCQMHCCNT
ncbi:MAG: Fe-S cluster assembly protein SufD [Bacteroidetes bacterium GWF2_33_16]|nr:MAG: Fe-S cluster assembly protein SufD [Bacteroidetes bacterium GWE2_32_14]OFY03972.1 MAG: Fe-S cluster assembly protein SufD [Bacteroidetes bacterium GWF2_33_16]